MSGEERQRFGNAMAWILRGMTALGAVFLMDMHSTIKDNNSLLQDHLRRYEADQTLNRAEIGMLKRNLEILERSQHRTYDP